MHFAIPNAMHGRETLKETGLPGVKFTVVNTDWCGDDIVL